MNDVKIYFENETDTTIDAAILDNMKRVIEKTVAEEYDGRSFEVSVTIVTNDKIRALNAEYRGKDAPTDVLSFPMDEFDDTSHVEPLGDVVISIERAKKQAEEYGQLVFSQRADLVYLVEAGHHRCDSGVELHILDVVRNLLDGLMERAFERR